MATPMIRKQIYLDRKTDARLKKEAKKRGISQAALIRERLDADSAAVNVAIPNASARENFLTRLEWVRDNAADGVGTGWRFSREETYAERNEKARPTRHQSTSGRRRSA